MKYTKAKRVEPGAYVVVRSLHDVLQVVSVRDDRLNRAVILTLEDGRDYGHDEVY